MTERERHKWPRFQQRRRRDAEDPERVGNVFGPTENIVAKNLHEPHKKSLWRAEFLMSAAIHEESLASCKKPRKMPDGISNHQESPSLRILREFRTNYTESEKESRKKSRKSQKDSIKLKQTNKQKQTNKKKKT